MPSDAAALPGAAVSGDLSPSPEGTTIAHWLHRYSRLGAVCLMTLGCSVLAGWALDLELLKRMSTTLATMKPNAALLFVLLGAALWRLRRPRDPMARRLAVAVVVIGAATVAEYGFGFDLHIDALLFRDPSPATPWTVPGRMSAVTAICFVLLGAAALMLDSGRLIYLAHAAACVVLTIAFLALCGLLYRAESMYGIGPSQTTAIHTIVGGLFASTTVLTVRTDRGFMSILASETGAGALLRLLTPALVLIPVIFAYLGLHAESRGVYDARFGDALLVTSTVVITFGATAMIARKLHRSEMARTFVQSQLLDRERALAESEYKYRDLYERAPDMYGSVRTADGILVDCNQTLLDAIGRNRPAVVGHSVFNLYDPTCIDRVRAAFDSFKASGVLTDVELTLLRSDGSRIEVSLSATAIRDSDGRILRSRAVWRDISARRRIEELKERDRFFQLSVDMVSIANRRGCFLQISPAFCSSLGYATAELTGRSYLEFVHPDDREATVAEARCLDAGQPVLRLTNRFRCKDGEYRWLQWRMQPDASGMIYSIARDITEDIRASQELRRSEESLRASLREREVLLQEVHHRVKNNLQVVSSLINMQVRQLADRGSEDALRECQSRIHTIALIHEKLYQSDDYARVPFSDYATGLVANIFEAAGGTSGPISLEIATDRISLAVDKAIPCGLILNELVSNALKHAFGGNVPGRVRVELRQEHGTHMTLAVSDDGVGFPADFDAQTTATLGVQLIWTLAEQLQGRIEIERGVGTTVRVRFPMEGSP